jgi:hypothetical protein
MYLSKMSASLLSGGRRTVTASAKQGSILAALNKIHLHKDCPLAKGLTERYSDMLLASWPHAYAHGWPLGVHPLKQLILKSGLS